MLKIKLFIVTLIATESDFDDTPITLNIPPGESSAIVSVRITPNIRVEDDESFDVILHSNSSGVTIGSPSQCIVTIIDDDGKYDLFC